MSGNLVRGCALVRLTGIKYQLHVSDCLCRVCFLLSFLLFSAFNLLNQHDASSPNQSLNSADEKLLESRKVCTCLETIRSRILDDTQVRKIGIYLSVVVF